MALKSYSALAEKMEGLKVKATVRNFSVILDEPEEQGGTNFGMNPIELALCSISACQTITAIILADFYGIPLEDIKVENIGEIDPEGFSNLNVKTGLQKISSKFQIKSNVPKSQIEELIKMVEKICPVGASFKNSVEFNPPEIILNI